MYKKEVIYHGQAEINLEMKGGFNMRKINVFNQINKIKKKNMLCE